MTTVILDLELAGNHRGDAGSGPHLSHEPMRFRALLQQLRDLRTLLRRQLRRRSGRALMPQRRAAAAPPCPCEPLTDRPLRHAQSLGDPFTAPSLLV